MSARYLNSDTPTEQQNIQCHNLKIRNNVTAVKQIDVGGNLSVAGEFTAEKGATITDACVAENFGTTNGKAFAQVGTIAATVDASGAGTSRTFQLSTVTTTLAAAASSEFLFLVPAGSLGTSPSYHNVICAVYDYSGSYATDGTPWAWVGSIDPTQNRLRIIVKNLANAQALNGVIKLNITIQSGTASV